MITIRNQDTALPFSARAGAADLKVGMVVKFAIGSASGEQPTVIQASAADMLDSTIKKGIVDFHVEDSTNVDFDVTLTSSTLVAQAKLIPLNEQVVVWTNKPIVAYHQSALDASITFSSLREAAKIGFSETTNFPGLYSGGATDGRQVYAGWVYRMDGPEATIAFETL